MFKALIVIFIVFSVLASFLMWAMCVAAGRADRLSEKMREERAENWWH